MSDVFDAAVCNARHVVLFRQLTDFVNGGALGPSDGANFLRDANGSRSHSDPERVDSSANQVQRLILRHHVAANHLQMGMFTLWRDGIGWTGMFNAFFVNTIVP